VTAKDPDGRRPPRARGDFPHHRLAAVLAALVVLGGVTAGIVATVIEGPNIGEDTTTAQTLPRETVSGAASAELASVQGPAAALADELRRRGYDARVEDGDVHIVVTEGVPPVLVNFLATLPSGPVAVIAETP
jgi:hypothetical protein